MGSLSCHSLDFHYWINVNSIAFSLPGPPLSETSAIVHLLENHVTVGMAEQGVNAEPVMSTWSVRNMRFDIGWVRCFSFFTLPFKYNFSRANGDPLIHRKPSSPTVKSTNNKPWLLDPGMLRSSWASLRKMQCKAIWSRRAEAACLISKVKSLVFCPRGEDRLSYCR